MKLKDCLALAEVPFFELDDQGRLVLAQGIADKIIDFHTHLGLHFLFAPAVDIDREDPETKTFFPLRGNPLDMEVYAALAFTPENARIMEKENLKQAWRNNGYAATHSAKNLLAELDRTRVEKSVILAIDYPLGPLSRNSELYLRAAQKYPRLIPFVSVHAYQPGMEKKVRAFREQGAAGMKIHPPMQLVRANNPRVKKLLQLCGELGMPCLFHSGASDVAPAFQKDLPRIAYFWEPVAEMPEVTFILGHAGIHMYQEAIKLAQRHSNVYLELSGQPPARIREMLEAGLEDRLLFGSDWPFYPIAFPLAKVLLATEDAPAARQKILYDNARGLLTRFGIA
jgi:predicted TIM-barrel fold metal-dependent hydrolase